VTRERELEAALEAARAENAGLRRRMEMCGAATVAEEEVPLVALYVTGNAGKHEEAQHIVRLLRGEGALQLERVKLDLPELQGSAEEIAVAKTRAAEAQLRGKTGRARFIITDDSGLGLSCLNGFPGVYIKPMLEALQAAGIGEIISRYDDKSAT